MTPSRYQDEAAVLSKRHTTIHDRYQISDECCGLVTTSTSLKAASNIARAHAARHAKEVDNSVSRVDVFDSMARRDCTSLWSFGLDGGAL